MKFKIMCTISLFLVFITGAVHANTTGTSSVQLSSDNVNVQLSDTSSQVIAQLKAGETINILSNSGKLIKINYGDNLEGYIDSAVVNGISDTNASTSGLDPRLDALVKLAKSKVGGGYDDSNWPHDFTCNGFITYLYLHIYDEARGLAVNLPSNGIYQDNFCTVRYDAKEVLDHVKNGGKMDDYLRPGDVIYYHGVNWNKAGHVEMYIGNDQMIGSGGGTVSVKINNAKEELLSGKLHLICRIIDGNNINTKDPKSEIRPLRKFPAELNINLYDYDALQSQGIMVVDDFTKRSVLVHK